VRLTAPGSCFVTASQPGDANRAAAADVTQSFTISKAPAKCKVPRLVGVKLSAAKLTLKKAHCVTGSVSRAYSSKTKRGRVSAQSRKAGAVLAANAKVNLVVSRGPKPRRR
jgi:beta-lactam-binding protein with PASTA domain